MAFADYIVFMDESGSPVLENPDPDFPLFVLGAVLVSKSAYVDDVVPRLQRLKFAAIGHDQLILHERDIRRQQKDFAFLQVDVEARQAFIAGINEIVADAAFEVIAAVIDKVRLVARYADPWSPYELALHFCLEKLLERLLVLGQDGRMVHVVFEGRGKREDRELELHFRRIVANEARWGRQSLDFTRLRWEAIFADKKSNSSGLQLADLIARPVGLKVLRPVQENRAFEILRLKLAPNGLKVFP
ncbi:DUF3800 domain-containing protein [Caulobacter sp. BK020]|uniref:DUF3800 domain-containing protein n=1 Tax=Caulobacter sp. BK020 TaxID=2512117 RepID=UPI00104FB6B3|nr:DUF3800 domain-containing protein [Caulobacter sp. BK020]TCS16006.1 uncharacterized protein DUF3800 [Caulobacter sp. BK020]